MRAILIDPYTKSITEVDHAGGLASILQAISCEVITIVAIGQQQVIYVDDEGLLHEPKPFFKWGSFPQPIAGKGLIVGVDAEGDDAPATIPLEACLALCSFPAVRYTGSETTVDEFANMTIIKSKANFERLQ